MKKRLTKYIALILLSSLILISAGVIADYYVKNRLEQRLVNDYSVQEKIVSEEVANSLSSNFTNIQNSLKAIALDKDIQSGSPGVCSAALTKYYTRLDLGIGNLGRVGLDGKFRCSINAALVGTSASRLGNYLDPLFGQSDHPAVVSHKLVVPKVKGFVVAVHVPVYDSQHNFVGSVGGAVYMNQLAETYLSKVRFAQTGFAGLQDDNGDVLYSQTTGIIGKNFFSTDVQSKVGNTVSFNKAIRAAYAGTPSIIHYSFQKVDKVGSLTPFALTSNHRWVVLVNVPEKEIASQFVSSGLNRAFDAVVIIGVSSLIIVVLLLLVITVRSYEFQRAKDEFVSLASHQLKTPATAVKQYLGLVLQGLAKTKQEQLRYTQAAYDSNERQIRIVEDLLNVSRVELDRITLSKAPTNLAELLRMAAKEQDPQIKQRKQTIEIATPNQPCTAVIDASYVRMIVDNLISNASKYTPEGKHLKLVLQPKGKNFKIEMHDQGVGITKKDQKQLFKKFSRIDNPLSVKAGGTGLGLYLVWVLVKMHGGRIDVTSALGRGTTFTVTLPKGNA